jgi:hypothetical protein
MEDLFSRSLHWFLFPLLAGALAVLQYERSHNFSMMWQAAAINIGFILLQLLLVSAYFSIRTKKLANVANGLLGLGDILFLLSITIYFSVLNFLAFYIFSLVITLLFWTIWQSSSPKANKTIPLAGIQSFLFILVLTGDWWVRSFDLTNDSWLLNLMVK